jgi:hypothetical protein
MGSDDETAEPVAMRSPPASPMTVRPVQMGTDSGSAGLKPRLFEV